MNPKLKKIIFSIAFIILLLMIYILISTVDNKISIKNTYPQYENFNTFTTCENSKIGWECSFDINWTEDKELNVTSIFQSECNKQGGTFNCYGYCMPDYNHYCDFIFKDSNKFCITSLQCGGKCIKKENNFFGRCSEHILRFCDDYKEFNFGFTTLNRVECD